MDAGLIVSWSVGTDKNQRRIILDCDGRAWHRVCASCRDIILSNDATGFTLTKTEFISCTASAFKEFCITYKDIADEYKLGSGNDKWNLPSIYVDDKTGIFIHGQIRNIPVARFFDEDNVFDLLNTNNSDSIQSDNEDIDIEPDPNTNTVDSKVDYDDKAFARGRYKAHEIRLLFDFLKEKEYDGVMAVSKFLDAEGFAAWMRGKEKHPREKSTAYDTQYVHCNLFTCICTD